MSKGVLFFILFWIGTCLFIYAYEHISKREKVKMLKVIGFGALTAFIALLLVSGLVYLF